VTSGREKKSSPLWHYKVNVGRTPPPPRARGGPEGLPPREITEAHLNPLRLDSEWRPSLILREFGPARTDREYLSRLIVACAVFQGVHRILELSEKLLSLFTVAQPRVKAMLHTESLAKRKDVLLELAKMINAAKFELAQTRARAANDITGEPQSPDGLRLLDLDILSNYVESAVLAHEMTSRRNVTGLEYGIAVAFSLPHQRYAEEWLERLLGTAQMHGALLFTPPEYARVILVYADGRLAYDPGASAEDADST
jgi:hypothetical protein